MIAMTVEKALKKVGEMEKLSSTLYSKKIGKNRLNFFDNGGMGTITCIHIDYYDNDNKVYHTEYFPNITQALKRINEQ